MKKTYSYSNNDDSSRNVAVICPRFPPVYGGPGIAFSRMANILRNAGVSATILTKRSSDCVNNETCTDTAGMKVLEIYTKNGRNGRIKYTIIALYKLWLLRKEYMAIQVFSLGWITFILPILGKMLRKRTTFMLTLLGSDDPQGIKRSTLGSLKVRLFKFYDSYIAINPEQIKEMKKYGIEEKKIVIGSVGIDVDFFNIPTDLEKSAARDNFGIGHSVPVAAFAGDIIARKGIYEAVEIWIKVLKVFPDAIFLILGPALTEAQINETLYPGLKKIIYAAKREKNIRFLWLEPSRNTVKLLMHASDIYLFPSHKEGTPSSVMEAMACGVPPALTELPGFTNHIVEDNINGLVLSQKQGIENWVKRIICILKQSEIRKQMGIAGRERVIMHHSRKVALNGYLKAWGFSTLDK